MKIRNTANGKIFDLPQHVATGLARSKSNTYELITDEPADTDPGDTGAATELEGPPASSWTVAQLKAYAQARNIELGGATRKADVWAAVSATLDGGTPDPTGENAAENTGDDSEHDPDGDAVGETGGDADGDD